MEWFAQHVTTLFCSLHTFKPSRRWNSTSEVNVKQTVVGHASKLAVQQGD